MVVVVVVGGGGGGDCLYTTERLLHMSLPSGVVNQGSGDQAEGIGLRPTLRTR